jgi:hypothetical protein
MTRLGKVLVFFNFALAAFLAAFAFNVYANGIDWTDSKDKGSPPMPAGEFAKRAARLKEMWDSVPPTQTNWLTERAKLSKEEASLVADRQWYDKEIRYVLDGPAQGKGVLQVAVAAKDDDKASVKKGQILLDDRGFPALVPLRDADNNPLQLLSLAEYNKKDEELLRMIGDVIAKHEQQIAESNRLTDLIIGSKTARGFQQRINDEKTKYEELLAEIKLVEPQYINTLVEAQLINKRHAQMVQRIEELKKTKVTAKR